jgi:hypothetical protein
MSAVMVVVTVDVDAVVEDGVVVVAVSPHSLVLSQLCSRHTAMA